MDDVNTPIVYLGLVDDEDIALDIAALRLSALDRGDIDIAPYLDTLDEMEEALAGLGEIDTPRAQAQALAQVIAGDFGFVGDRTSYDAPVNADMIRVFDRRMGLPVSLAILYVALARRLDWIAHAMNTPGHVVVAIGPLEEAVFCDPFGGGNLLAEAQLSGLVGAQPEADLAGTLREMAMSNRMTLARLLLNQAVRAEHGGDAGRAAVVYERMTVVAPGDGKGWWELARLRLASGDLAGARECLSAMLETTRDPMRREAISAALDAIGQPG